MLARVRRLPWPLKILVALAVIAVGIQLVPYGRDHDNPRTVAEPSWSSVEVRELAVAACFDCHSNETEWPWYSNIAPMSWLVQRDVDNGRAALNFSEWDGDDSDDAAEAVEDGSMPPAQYRWMHSGARLSTTEKLALAAEFEQLARNEGEDRSGSNSGSG